ncbi:hypothetical protein OH807_20170 [Kitasatospora sp. NBC_01560]
MSVVLLTGLFVSVVFVGIVAQITASRRPREHCPAGREPGRAPTGPEN